MSWIHLLNDWKMKIQLRPETKQRKRCLTEEKLQSRIDKTTTDSETNSTLEQVLDSTIILGDINSVNNSCIKQFKIDGKRRNSIFDFAFETLNPLNTKQFFAKPIRSKSTRENVEK